LFKHPLKIKTLTSKFYTENPNFEDIRKMLIANPIYDVVFRYLMEDTEIAKGLLSKIIGQEIIELTFEPQVVSSRSKKFELIILRLDFRAIIKTADGIHKKVLIELQKGKNPLDILRFRKYLAENYSKEDVFENKETSLPIITIYFLGFKLKNVETPVLKIDRQYYDLINNKTLETTEEFVEKLTHDSYVIQIMRLDKTDETELEKVLKVFNQTYISKDQKLLVFEESDIEGSEILQLMTKRLRLGATEEKLLKEIQIEEEIESTIEQHIREKQGLQEKNEELKDEVGDLKKQLEDLNKKLKDQ